MAALCTNAAQTLSPTPQHSQATCPVCGSTFIPVAKPPARLPHLARAAAISVSKRCFQAAKVSGVTMVPWERISASLRSSASSARFLSSSGSSSSASPFALACAGKGALP